MKEIQVELTATRYVCETCSEQFEQRSSAERCETDHRRKTCSHKMVRYFWDGCDSVLKLCADCDLELANRSVDEDDQEKLAALFELLGEGR